MDAVINLWSLPLPCRCRLRATVRVARGASEEVVREAALAEANVSRQLDGMRIRKVIHIPDRMLNLVVS